MHHMILKLAGAALLLTAAIQPAAAQDAEVAVKLFQFQPKALTVKPGTAITWMNGDDIEHSVTAGEPGKETKAFDSGFFVKGESFTHSFAEPGIYSYFCKRHQSMRGTVTVE